MAGMLLHLGLIVDLQQAGKLYEDCEIFLLRMLVAARAMRVRDGVLHAEVGTAVVGGDGIALGRMLAIAAHRIDPPEEVPFARPGRCWPHSAPGHRDCWSLQARLQGAHICVSGCAV